MFCSSLSNLEGVLGMSTWYRKSNKLSSCEQLLHLPCQDSFYTLDIKLQQCRVLSSLQDGRMRYSFRLRFFLQWWSLVLGHHAIIIPGTSVTRIFSGRFLAGVGDFTNQTTFPKVVQQSSQDECSNQYATMIDIPDQGWCAQPVEVKYLRPSADRYMHWKQKDQAGGKISPTLQVADDHFDLDHLHRYAKEDAFQTKIRQQFHIGSGFVLYNRTRIHGD